MGRVLFGAMVVVLPLGLVACEGSPAAPSAVALPTSFSGASLTLAKKANLEKCPEPSDDQFGFKLSKKSGYQTFTYFSSSFAYLGMLQLDGEGAELFDTYGGDCGVPLLP